MLKKSVFVFLSSLILTSLISMLSFAQSIPYVRLESKYDPKVASVDIGQLTVVAKSSSYKVTWECDPDLSSYKEGDSYSIKATLTAEKDADFKDIKIASCKLDDEAAVEMSLSDDMKELHLTFEKTPLPVILEAPANLSLDREGMARWDNTENADSYTVILQKMTDKGQRKKIEDFKSNTNFFDLHDYVYGTPGDYLFAVCANSDTYWRYSSDTSSLPLAESVLTTREDVGADLSNMNKDGTVYEDKVKVVNREYKIGGKFYFFGEEGLREGGWKQDQNGWKYYDPLTLARVEGLKTIEGDTYYFAPDIGYMQTGFITVSEGKQMFFSKRGAAVFGWVKNNGKIYFVNKDGSINKKQLIDGNGKTYLFNNDGSLVK